MKQFLPFIATFVIIVFMFIPWNTGEAYPIWGGVEKTDIRRLIRLQRMDSAKFVRTLPYGARYSLPYVKLNLMGRPIDSNLMASNPELETKLEQLIPNRGRAYSLAIMDITPGRDPRYVERNANATYQPAGW